MNSFPILSTVNVQCPVGQLARFHGQYACVGHLYCVPALQQKEHLVLQLSVHLATLLRELNSDIVDRQRRQVEVIFGQEGADDSNP